MPAITLRDVEKRFGDVPALRGIDLEVDRGETFGFLGPNGAGKSTTIDLLLNYSHPTAGVVEVLGYDAEADPVEIRRRVGVLPEGFSPLGTMTGRQHLAYAVEATGADDDPDALLEYVGLAHAADRPASGYSKGMGQRLALAMALVGDPDLLILDEPSTGLDPHGVRRMREIIRETVGAEGTLEVTLADEPGAVAAAVESIDGVSSVAVREGGLTVSCGREAKLEVLDRVREAGGTITDFATADASLEELFVAYTGETR